MKYLHKNMYTTELLIKYGGVLNQRVHYLYCKCLFSLTKKYRNPTFWGKIWKLMAGASK